MKSKKKFKWFPILNTAFLLVLALICVIPLIHVAAVSFSSSAAASAGTVSLWPKEFTLNSYSFVAKRPAFWRSMRVSVIRIIMGGGLSLLLTITAAYPLSQPKGSFRFRTIYAWFFFVTMIFNAGLIPWYMVIRQFGLLDSIWALILPSAVPVFSVILLLNFFREVPRELAEAAFIDGAGHWRTLWTIYVPLSKPALATLLLFSLVANWNSWFDGLIYSNFTDNYPLQSYLQTMVVDMRSIIQSGNMEDIVNALSVNDKNLKAAQIFISIIPLMVIYPFCQKYFTAGLTLGSVKG